MVVHKKFDRCYQITLSEEEQRRIVDESMTERVPESIVIQQVLEFGLRAKLPAVKQE